jgi:hypothetical protein
MPRITVHAVNSAGEPRRWTLSERIVADNLDSDHYIAQLIERLAWATADAEAHESQSDGHDAGRQARHGARTIPSRGDGGPVRSRPRTSARTGGRGARA